MRKIKLLFLIGLMIASGSVMAQKGSFEADNNSGWQDRIYFGGGFGLSGGSWGGSIRLSPIVGYMITPRISAGVGATYEYYKYNSYYGAPFEDHRWGGMVFTRVNLIKQVFAYADYSFMNYTYNPNTEERRVVDRMPIGLGISQPIGNRSSLNFIAAYDVLYDSASPYNSPWVFSVFFSL